MRPTVPIERDDLEHWLAEATGRAVDPVAGLYGPDSMMWRIGRESLAFLGGGRAALLQLAHPWVANAIDQHSATRNDPVGRFNRTFVNVFSMVYGDLEQVAEVSRRVHHIHTAMKGSLTEPSGAFAQGSEYRANEAHAMMWVHATLWDTMKRMYELVFPTLSQAELDRYYEETRLFAYLFGIPDDLLPPDWASFQEYCEQMYCSDVLTVGQVGKEMGDMIFSFDLPFADIPLDWMRRMTAEMMPPRLREAFGLPLSCEKSRHWYERQLRHVRRVYPRLPRKLRFIPPYQEAIRRIRGLEGADWSTRTLNRLWLGQPELVSRRRRSGTS